MPNTRGARACPVPPLCLPGCPYAHQEERAEAYGKWVLTAAAKPFVVGWHWWQWVDEPRGGRWPDGENSNYGVVDINDEPYAALGDAMRTANHAAEAVHARHSEATAEH